MAKICQDELVASVAKVTEFPPEQIGQVLEQTLAEVITALQAGHEVQLKGFGAIHVRSRKARTIRNPVVGEMTLPETKSVAIRPFRALKTAMGGSE